MISEYCFPTKLTQIKIVQNKALSPKHRLIGFIQDGHMTSYWSPEAWNSNRIENYGKKDRKNLQIPSSDSLPAAVTWLVRVIKQPFTNAWKKDLMVRT